MSELLVPPNSAAEGHSQQTHASICIGIINTHCSSIPLKPLSTHHPLVPYDWKPPFSLSRPEGRQTVASSTPAVAATTFFDLLVGPASDSQLVAFALGVVAWGTPLVGQPWVACGEVHRLALLLTSKASLGWNSLPFWWSDPSCWPPLRPP
jgi:hypothetical protein